jgi:outer membrane receptor protein involved in Fe transport
MRFLHIVGVGLALLFMASPADAVQMAGRIGGQITDQTGAGLAGATVVLRSLATESEQSEATDSSGHYEFNGLSIGIYRLKVQRPGFSDAARSISLVEPGEAIEANFELNPGGILEAVTVTASRGERDVLEVPVRAQVLSEQVLQRGNPTTTGDALLTLPGLTPVNSGPYLVRPRLRGLDSTRLVLMVDGERLNTARVATDRAGPEIGLVDPSQIQSVEVVHGSGSALYGTDALAGTINLITDMPEPVNDALRIGGGFDGFYSSNENGRRGTVKLDVAGRKFAVRASFMRERYPSYHSGRPFSETSVPIIQPITVFSDTERKDPALFKADPGRAIQQIFFGVVPDPFNQPFTRTDSEVANSQSHGSNVSITGRLFPVQGQSVRIKLTQRRTATIGFPDFKPPIFFQVINLPFSDLDKASLRYEWTGVTSWWTRLSAGGYWQDQDRLLRNDFAVIGVSASDPRDPENVIDNLTRVKILSNTRQDVKSFGFDANVGFLFAARNVLTVGMDYFRDHSRDTRATLTDVTLIGTAIRTTGRFFPRNFPIVTGSVSRPQRVPISNFENVAFFAEDEYDANRWLRLLGSFRVDRIGVDTSPTPGYSAVIPSTNPPLDPETFPPVNGLIGISRTAVTGNVGVVVRPTQQLSLTARVGRSFRHPNLEELFFYGPATIGAIVPNITVKPETGINLDLGLKLRTSRVAGEVTYFNNTYRNFISTEIETVAQNDPTFANGQPISQAGNFFSRLRIQGLETNWEAPLLFQGTVFTWFGNLSYLRGEILKGKADLRTKAGVQEVDVAGAPADNISPFKSVVGLRWNDGPNRFWWEYNVRSQTRVNRVSLLLLDSPFLIPQDLFGLYGFSIHTAKGGYNFNRERYTMGVTLSFENVGNKFYREHFQFAPARGRSFTVGLNLRFF